MKKFIYFAMLASIAPGFVFAFCGLYVAKTDRKLFNKGSEVIIVRDGNNTVLTMSNDFEGDAKDFAMVVPVPIVIKKSDIKIADQSVFDILNAYSAPRLVEYYDENPCNSDKFYKMESMVDSAPMANASEKDVEKSAVKNKVKIEASYTVGEYDILVLSAKESDGLQNWLTENGYKIPENAKEVLTPYIKSNTKFFVAKVNLKNQKKIGAEKLRPLQIKFSSPKFMLPIRLGMANAKDVQDLIVYAFAKTGQVECTNYRTVEMPTDLDMPMMIKDKFSNFYKAIFTKAWKKNGKNIVLKEYAWDLSGTNYMHCDPCVGTIPEGSDLVKAGVWWLNVNEEYRYSGSATYQESVFMTRLHVRYDRANFPQDLQFQNTPNTENYQARYVLHHDATGDMSCEAANEYKQNLAERKKLEEYNLLKYAGWTKGQHGNYKVAVEPTQKSEGNMSFLFFTTMGGLVLSIIYKAYAANRNNNIFSK